MIIQRENTATIVCDEQETDIQGMYEIGIGFRIQKYNSKKGTLITDIDPDIWMIKQSKNGPEGIDDYWEEDYRSKFEEFATVWRRVVNKNKSRIIHSF